MECAKSLPEPTGTTPKTGPVLFGDLHQPVDHFVDSPIAAHGNDHIIALFASLLCQFSGVRGVDCAAPVSIAVFGDDGAQVVGHSPGIAHVCHGVQDDLDFAGHIVSSLWVIQS